MNKERKNGMPDFQEIRKKYQKILLENSNEGVLIIQDDSIVYADPHILEFMGLAQEDLSAGSYLDLVHPDDREKVMDVHRRRLEGETATEKYMFRALAPSGEVAYLEVTGMPTSWEGRDASFNLLTNVTERIRAKEEKEICNRKFRSLYEKMIESAVSVDKEGRITGSNMAFEKLLGLSEECIIGEEFQSFVHSDWVPEHNETRKNARSSGYCESYEISLLDKQERELPVEIRCYLVEDEKDKGGCWYFIKDISRRKKIQNVLAGSEKQLKMVLEYFPDPVLFLDLSFVRDYIETTITTIKGCLPGEYFTENPDEYARCLGNIRLKYANKQALRFFELERKDGIEGFLLDVRNTERTELILEVISRAWEGKPGYEKEVGIEISGGKMKSTMMKSLVLPGKEETWDTVLISLTDLSEKKNTIRQLEESKNKAEESDRLKTAFLANMSHEIRTPMNAIVGFSELLRATNAEGVEKEEYFNIIGNSCNTLSKLIDDIIDLAKIEAGQTVIVDDVCAPYGIMKELQRYFTEEIKKSGKPLKIIMDAQIDPSLQIKVDEFRLRQVLSNIIGNAVKFTDKGMISWGCEVLKNREIRYYVKDTGIGIDPSGKELIFDRFRQMDGSSVRKYGGTGLGLPVSKNLVELMGGRLWLESSYGKGSEFFFTIPYNPVNDNITERSLPEETSQSAEYVFRNKGILVVEDNVSNFEFIKAVLSRTEAKLFWADNGTKALDVFRKKRRSIDAILMDIQIPEIDGYETTKLIKKVDADIPVIAQTAFAMSRDREKAMEAGCDNYIPKPIKPSDLLDILGKYLVEQ